MRDTLGVAGAFKAGEVKQFVFPDRSTDRGAVLVLGKMPSGNAVTIIEVGVRVERAIAEVLPDISVERIAARLDAGVYHRAGRRAEFRGVGSRLNPELLEIIREEILSVVSRRLAVDEEQVQVNLAHEGGIEKLLANMPIRREKVTFEWDPPSYTPSDNVLHGKLHVETDDNE